MSYTLLPLNWGNGNAGEAVNAVLVWADTAMPNEPIVLCTQVANTPSLRVATRLGFTFSEQFVEFDALQWFGVRSSPHSSAWP